jgi:hypothetical protein
MVQPQCLILKYQQCEYGKNDQGDDFLYHLELKKTERAAIAIKADPIGWYLKGVFKKGDAPADQNDTHQAEATETFHVFKFQMPVPGQCHKRIGDDKKYDGDNGFLHVTLFNLINKDLTQVNRWECFIGLKTKMAAPFGTTTFEPMKT